MEQSRKIHRVLKSARQLHIILALTTAATGCEALGPIAMEVGKNLLSTAAYNYNPEYAATLENLVIALAKERIPDTADMAAEQPVQASMDSNQNIDMGSMQERKIASEEPIVLDVAILAQRMSPQGRMQPVPIADGATLRDGGDDPAAGDTLKIAFSANCSCYIYVVAIDASGYVEMAFPGQNLVQSNPVQQDRQYLLPEGSVWYGLDEVRGVETIYVVASYTRRTDLEQAIDQLAKTKRKPTAEYRPVTQATIIPVTRGLTKVDLSASMTVPAETGENYVITPDTFTSAISGADFVITRWFYHVSND